MAAVVVRRRAAARRRACLDRDSAGAGGPAVARPSARAWSRWRPRRSCCASANSTSAVGRRRQARLMSADRFGAFSVIRSDIRHAPLSSPLPSSFSFGPGPLSTALKALIGANVAMFLAHDRAVGRSCASTLGLMPTWVVHAAARLAARHLHVPARRPVPHPVQHAGAVDVRHRARADLGHALLPEVLLRHRHRRGRAHGAVLAAAVRARWRSSTHSTIIGASGAIYGLLLAYGLYFPDRPIYMYFVFPIPAKYFVMIMGAHRVLLVAGRQRRRRERDAPRRPARRLPLSQERAAAPSAGRAEVPLPEVEDQPRPQEVRRLLGRPRQTTGIDGSTERQS